MLENIIYLLPILAICIVIGFALASPAMIIAGMYLTRRGKAHGKLILNLGIAFGAILVLLLLLVLLLFPK